MMSLVSLVATLSTAFVPRRTPRTQDQAVTDHQLQNIQPARTGFGHIIGSRAHLPAIVALANRNDIKRRDVLQGGSNEAYKTFVKAGGGEATLFAIAAALAAYGGNQRSNLYDDIAALESKGRRQDTGSPSAPVVMSSVIRTP